MKPLPEQLRKFVDDKKSAALEFGVSVKTISRWMKEEGLYKPKNNYGNKLDLEKAREIRKKHSEGFEIKELAREYHVTFSTISRIVQNITYQEIIETAKVSVIYNVN